MRQFGASSGGSGMSFDVRTERVRDLLSSGVLWVEDGNHGENRPLADEFANEGTPFVRPDDLSHGVVDFANCDRINAKALQRVRKGKGRAGDIAFTHRATVGRIARLGATAPEFVANPGVTLWRVLDQSRIDPNYLYYFMQTPFFMNQVWAEAGNTDTFPYISLTQQRGLAIRYPKLVLQRAIGSVLSALDNRIALLRETNATLEAIAQALFKSWFVDFDPVRAKSQGLTPAGMDEATAALFPDGFEESVLGPVPAGWRTGSILEVANLLSGGTPKTDRPEYWGGDIPWASAKDVSQSSGSVLVSTERSITAAGLERSPTRLIPRLATVVVARGATTGRMVMFGREMAMNQTCYGLTSKRSAPVALYCQLRRGIDVLVNSAHGSVFDTITTSTFAKSIVVHAPEELLARFESIARPLFERIEESTSRAQTLSALRDALLPRLISGQLRLPEIEAIGSEVSA